MARLGYSVSPIVTPTDSWSSYFDSWKREDLEVPMVFEPVIADDELPPESLDVQLTLDFDLDWELELAERCSPMMYKNPGQGRSKKLNDANPAHHAHHRHGIASRRLSRPGGGRRRPDDVDGVATRLSDPEPPTSSRWLGLNLRGSRGSGGSSGSSHQQSQLDGAAALARTLQAPRLARPPRAPRARARIGSRAREVGAGLGLGSLGWGLLPANSHDKVSFSCLLIASVVTPPSTSSASSLFTAHPLGL